MSLTNETLMEQGEYDNREPDIDAIEEARYEQEMAAKEYEKFKEQEQEDLEELNG